MFNRKLKEKIREQEEKIKKLEWENNHLKELGKDNAELKSKLNSLRSKLTNTKKKIREQTEADLFFVTAKIQKELLEGKTKEEIAPLYAQLQGLQQSHLEQQQQGQSLRAGLFGNFLGR